MAGCQGGWWCRRWMWRNEGRCGPWPGQVAEEGRVSRAAWVGVSWLSYRICGDFAQPLLDCGQTAAEGLDFCVVLFFCPGESVFVVKNM